MTTSTTLRCCLRSSFPYFHPPPSTQSLPAFLCPLVLYSSLALVDLFLSSFPLESGRHEEYQYWSVIYIVTGTTADSPYDIVYDSLSPQQRTDFLGIFYGLQITGAFGLGLILITTAFSKSLKPRHPLLVNMLLCWFLFGLSNSLL